MHTESRRVLRGALLVLGLTIGLTACSGPKVLERPDPPPGGPSTIPPEIGRIRPSNGANNQPPGLNVTATFKVDMDESSFDENTFSLFSGGEYADAKVTYDAASKTATLDPSDPLPGGKFMTAQLDGVKTAAGDTVDHFWWTFRIE